MAEGDKFQNITKNLSKIKYFRSPAPPPLATLLLENIEKKLKNKGVFEILVSEYL